MSVSDWGESSSPITLGFESGPVLLVFTAVGFGLGPIVRVVASEVDSELAGSCGREERVASFVSGRARIFRRLALPKWPS